MLLNRLLFYNDADLKNDDAALSEAEAFFNAGYPAEDYISQDYLYYGRLLINNKQTEKGIAQLQKALELDPKQVALYQEIAEAYETIDNYDSAIANYSLYIQHMPEEEVQVTDYYNIGRAAYFAGSSIDTTVTDYAVKQKAYLNKADSMFAFVAEKVPDSYLGYFWRARVQSALDPETTEGLAKPYYEKTIEVLDAQGDDRPQIYIECYSYLGYYYFVKEDVANSKTYWEKILAIDPEHEVAKRALEAMK